MPGSGSVGWREGWQQCGQCDNIYFERGYVLCCWVLAIVLPEGPQERLRNDDVENGVQQRG